MKKDLKGSIEKYLKSEEVPKDYLLGNLISFIKEKGVFPSQNEMRQLEIKAEAKRVAKHGISLRDITWQEVLKEILELAEEIMEIERDKNPRSVYQCIVPFFQERLWVETDKFRGDIIHRVDAVAKKDIRDYKCVFIIKCDYEVDNVQISYWSDNMVHITARDWRDEKLAISDSLRINEYITMIHKGIVELAEKEGIEFMSEVEDYQVIK